MQVNEIIAELETGLTQIEDPEQQIQLISDFLGQYWPGTEYNGLLVHLAKWAEALPFMDALFTAMVKAVSKPVFQHDANLKLLFLQQCLGIAELYNNPIYIAQFNLLIGVRMENMGNITGALEHHLQALTFYEQLDDAKSIAKVQNRIGDCYWCQENFAVALEHSLKALEVFERLGDKFNIGIVYNSIGNIYMESGDLQPGLEYHFKSLEVTKQIDDKEGSAYSYNNIGRTYDKMGDYEKALEYQLKSLALFQELESESQVANIRYNTGCIFYRCNDAVNAMKYLHRALAEAEKIVEPTVVNGALVMIGNVYRLQNEYDLALEFLHKGLTMAEGSGVKEFHYNALEGLYKAYKEKGDSANALDYYEKYVQEKEEIARFDNNRKIANIHFGFELEKKKREVHAERTQREIVEEKNKVIDAERQKSDALLKNILPDAVAEDLKATGKSDANLFEVVTVLFTDFKGFTSISERLTPQQLVDELHACFSVFDEITTKYNVEKIKTVGDAYLAVSGLPVAHDLHAENIVHAAIEIRDFMLNRRNQLAHNTFEIRIGLHSGPVVAGIVGVKKFAYDIWGDTVNLAARMEQHGEPGKINISHSTYELVKHKFECAFRGEIEAKNKGKLKMYFIHEPKINGNNDGPI